ncbi:MAG: hypothetical protein ABS58_01525 [Mesorhizobium sp. SCN 65-20]|nr:MAG: hypothetical protein ABS58_01525 [Mesorhizobium sp. SCN 65-20]
MTIIAKGLLAAALLLSAPAFAEEAHHQPSATAGAPASETVPADGMDAMPGGKAPGMMGGDMMKEMKGRHAEMMGGAKAMQDMMSPERIEGRIAFLRAELKITDAQETLWVPVAEALRSNASKGGMAATMRPEGAGKRLPQRLADMERMASSHLDALRRLNAAIAPLYEVLEEKQKDTADDLLLPMGMM